MPPTRPRSSGLPRGFGNSARRRSSPPRTARSNPAFCSTRRPIWRRGSRRITHDHAHAHSHGIDSFALFFDAPLPWPVFEQVMAVLTALRGPDLLRVKGLVAVAGCKGPVVVHAVQHVAHRPIELEDWPDGDRRSRLVFITRDLPQEAVEQLFRAIRAVGTGTVASRPHNARPDASGPVRSRTRRDSFAALILAMTHWLSLQAQRRNLSALSRCCPARHACRHSVSQNRRMRSRCAASGRRPKPALRLSCHVFGLGGGRDHAGHGRVGDQVFQEKLRPARAVEFGRPVRQRAARAPGGTCRRSRTAG